MELPIYLDNHATTPVDPRVVNEMVPYFTSEFGNAASAQHQFGWKAAAAVKNARKRIADLVGATEHEIIFTSGATESINLALKGVAESYRSRGKHVITAATEHKATLDTCARLERHGFTVTQLHVDRSGRLDLIELENSIRPETILVSVMMANNEIGTLYPVEEIGRICRDRSILFHSDAAQAAGKIPIEVKEMNIDLLSLTSHKMYGPKGIGALAVRGGSPRIMLMPQIDGGGHERGLRSGTLNVPAIVGFGKAAEIANREFAREGERLTELREAFIQGLISRIEGASVNGDLSDRLAGNANMQFPGVKSDRLISRISDVAFSAGSACSSANPKPSHVLKAIGLSDEEAGCSVRFGIGRFNTKEEIDFTVDRVAEAVASLRQTSSTHQMEQYEPDSNYS